MNLVYLFLSCHTLFLSDDYDNDDTNECKEIRTNIQNTKIELCVCV